MNFEIAGDGWLHSLKVVRDTLGRDWRVTDAEGMTHAFEVEEIDGGSSFRITLGDSIHNVTVLPGNRPGQPLRYVCDHSYYELEVRDPIDLLAATLGAGDAASGHAELLSEMPGVIRKVMVAAGDTVAAGDPVLILEAMKMENEVLAPADGVVSELRIQIGDTVATGDLLAIISP